MKSFTLCLVTLLSLLQLIGCMQLASESNFVEDFSKNFEIEIRMKNSIIEKKEDSRCTFIKLDPEIQFITEIRVKGVKEVNHHISLVACEHLPDIDLSDPTISWNCEKVGICGKGLTRRIYTWALDAPGIKYEPNVGYKLSGNTDLNYLVVNSHYNDAIEVGYVDNETAYRLKMTKQELEYQVGVYTLGDNGYIPAHREKFHMDSGCRVSLKYDIVPIFYRTHAHNIIRVISGYLIQNEDDEWIELGRMSPRQPQAFYPVTNKNQVVERGDYLASRCTANSMARNYTTATGHKHKDEMCVFYLMFYTDYTGFLKDNYCFKDVYQMKNIFSFKNSLPGRAPENNDDLRGVFLMRPEYEEGYEKAEE